MTKMFGYVLDERDENGHLVVVGPFPDEFSARTAAGDLRLVEWGAEREFCTACSQTHDRLPMDEDTAKVYDALFPQVLDWSEDDDCGMPALMRDVAAAAVAALK